MTWDPAGTLDRRFVGTPPSPGVRSRYGLCRGLGHRSSGERHVQEGDHPDGGSWRLPATWTPRNEPGGGCTRQPERLRMRSPPAPPQTPGSRRECLASSSVAVADRDHPAGNRASQHAEAGTYLPGDTAPMHASLPDSAGPARRCRHSRPRRFYERCPVASLSSRPQRLPGCPDSGNAVRPQGSGRYGRSRSGPRPRACRVPPATHREDARTQPGTPG